METLSKGYDEVQRLRHVRIMSFGKIVESIRHDISALWDEIGVERDDLRESEFPGYFEAIELLEDSSVDEHETYYSSLKKRVEELRPLLQKIHRREVRSHYRHYTHYTHYRHDTHYTHDTQYTQYTHYTHYTPSTTLYHTI